jgi:hypothetical protein
MVHWWNDTERENWSTWIKTCLSATSSTKNTMRNCLGLNPASTVTGCHLSVSLPEPWHSLLIYWLLCVCVKWLLLVTSHTAAVCDCVTVQMSIHEQTLYTHCIICVKCASSHIAVTSWQVTSIHKQLYRQWINWRHRYCQRTHKHKQFHQK